MRRLEQGAADKDTAEASNESQVRALLPSCAAPFACLLQLCD